MSRRPQVWLEITHLLASPTGNKSGIGYYTENLIRAVAKQNSDYDFWLVGNLFATSPIPDFVKSMGPPTKISRFFPGKVWNAAFKKGFMPPINRIHGGQPDFVINFNFVRYPVSPGTKTITFIHDLAFEKFPEHVQEKNLQYLRKFVPIAVKESDRLIAISQSTKRDVEKMYGVPANLIDVVYGAVDEDRHKRKYKELEIRKKYRLPDKYVFFIGNNEPRKNLVNLIQAFCTLSDEERKGHVLVLAGSTGWKNEQLDRVYNEVKSSGKVLRLGYVDEADVPALYSLSTFFAFPSFYEGFGLPILEAMAAATPVLTSRESSMEEVAAKAAYYVDDPNDVDEIAHAIRKLISNSKLRDTLRKAGLQREKEFTWSKSAEQLINAIKKVDLG